VLIGGGIGAAAGAVLDRNKVTVVVIDPDRDLTLTLNSDLTLR
jgi:2-polyprenyl-6-methoxyphenol hydroxylase-like FAD-dependent oxidoreductase